MSETFDKSTQQALPGFGDATSSEGLPDGSMHSNSPDGAMPKSGLEAAPASRSRTRGSGKRKPTNVICGQRFLDSSPSAALQWSLENKLQVLLDVNGSPEYALTWRRWSMPSGPPICALRASERPTDDSGFIGWPTPVAQPANGSPERFLERKRESVERTGRSMGIVLSDLAMVSEFALRGWQTPKAHDGEWSEPRTSGRPIEKATHLQTQAQHTLRGWVIPRARDHKNNGVSIARAAKGVADSLDLQCKLVCQNGMDQPSPLSARMDGGAYRLNPRHSLWLQGFPSEWENFAVLETA